MKRILITGKNSYVGTSVKKYLERWPKKYKVDELDVKGNAWKSFDFNKYDVVFHVAGIAHINRIKKDEQTKNLYFSVNTDLAEAVAKKAKREHVKQFIQMSSMSIYGDSAPIGKKKVIYKNTKPVPTNYYGESKLQAEIKLNKLTDNSFKLAILRPPMIYGVNCKGNYAVLRMLALRLRVFPKVKNERSMIYIDNFSEFIKIAIDNQLCGIFCPSNKETFVTSEIVKEIAKQNNRKILIIPGFSWLLKIMSHVTPFVNKAFGNMAYDSKAISADLNYWNCSTVDSIRVMESDG